VCTVTSHSEAEIREIDFEREIPWRMPVNTKLQPIRQATANASMKRRVFPPLASRASCRGLRALRAAAAAAATAAHRRAFWRISIWIWIYCTYGARLPCTFHFAVRVLYRFGADV